MLEGGGSNPIEVIFFNMRCGLNSIEASFVFFFICSFFFLNFFFNERAI